MSPALDRLRSAIYLRNKLLCYVHDRQGFSIFKSIKSEIFLDAGLELIVKKKMVKE
jgi:hypothetical protein